MDIRAIFGTRLRLEPENLHSLVISYVFELDAKYTIKIIKTELRELEGTSFQIDAWALIRNLSKGKRVSTKITFLTWSYGICGDQMSPQLIVEFHFDFR